MEGIEGTSERRILLEQVMNDRRRTLRIKWTEVARRAGMSVQNLLRIRKGQISISEDAADGIEYALEWERGSVAVAVLHGRRPIERGAGSQDQEWPEWLTPERRADLSEKLASQGMTLTPEAARIMRDETEKLKQLDQQSSPVTPGDRSN